jgi:hypothetical protein
MTEKQARNSLAFGFASPIAGAAIGVILGLAIYDIFDTFEQWTVAILIALLGFSIWLGANKSGEALAYFKKTGELSAAKGAANLNSVLAIVWMAISFFVSFTMAIGAVNSFVDRPVYDGREPYNPGEYSVVLDSTIFVGEFLPAVVIVAMAMFGFVFQLVATSKEDG